MKHLTGLDAAFLYLESPEMPMHVGSLHVYELKPGYRGSFYEDVKEHIRKRMHLAPVFHRKLALMPFDIANPVWIEDDDVDLDHFGVNHIIARLDAQGVRDIADIRILKQ